MTRRVLELRGGHRLMSLLEAEQQHVEEMKKVCEDVRGPVVTDGILLEEDAEKIFGPLEAVIELSTAMVEMLEKSVPLGEILEKITPMLYVHGRYVENYHSFVEPFLSAHEGIRPWVMVKGFFSSVKNLLEELGKPVSRVMKWRVSVRLSITENPTADLNRKQTFIRAADDHIATVFEKITSLSNQKLMTPITDRLPKHSTDKKTILYHSGELVKEYARGRHVRRFYLFSDKLVHFKVTAKGLTHTGLKGGRNVLLLSDIVEVFPEEDSVSRAHVFRIQREGRKDMVLMAETAEEKSYWVQLLRMVVASENTVNPLGFNPLSPSQEVPMAADVLSPDPPEPHLRSESPITTGDRDPPTSPVTEAFEDQEEILFSEVDSQYPVTPLQA